MSFKPVLIAAALLASLPACAPQPKETSPPAPQAALPAAEPAQPEPPAAPVAPAWKGDVFKVCADPNNPPYSDKQGRGFENKIAELFARQLGKKLEYYWFPQRMGFVRRTLKEELTSGEFRCDVIMGYPTGADMAATTKPYYRSTYAIVYAKKRGFDDIKSQEDLAQLPPERRAKLKLAMFDSSPASTWLLKHGLVDHAIPYQTMTGDGTANTAEVLEKDMKAGKLDMAIVWGPIAGWLRYHNKIGPVELIPMHAEDDDKEARFAYPMSMAVRFPDKARKAELERLIGINAAAIRKILGTYQVPLVD